VSDFVRSLTDRARLYGKLRQQRQLEALAEFRRAIENGEDPDGL
jgi:hypothetical protein